MPLLTPRLIRHFQTIHAEHGTPRWAWPVSPSVPFVGREYQPASGLLVYGSAENLSWLADAGDVVLYRPHFNGESAWDRYRRQFEELGEQLANGPFPWLGIQPVTNGGLVAAAWLVAWRLGLPVGETPREMLERLAVTNFGKFAMATGRVNRDYAGEKDRLAASLPYIDAELRGLRPAVVLVPRAAWRQRSLAAVMKKASPASHFLPVPQFNATVVNVHLGEHHDAGKRLRRVLADTPVAAWMPCVRTMREANAWRYLAWLDERLQQTPASPVST